MSIPVDIGRPVRVTDSRGSYTETINEVGTVWMDVVEFGPVVVVSVEEDADVRVGDLIRVPYIKEEPEVPPPNMESPQ